MKKYINKLTNFHIALILLAVIFLSHIDIVLAPLGYYMCSLNYGDLVYYINIREFAFGSLSLGVFPFWTTKILCGVPFFANYETAIFYLPNIIFFFLPISKAINFSFLVHLFVLSFSVFLWIDNKMKDKLISVVTGIVSAFGAIMYIHICQSHLSNLITAAWFPFLLYFYDKSFEKKSYFYIFPVSFILSVQIFAGHLQYVYYTALVSLLYVLLFCRNRFALVTIFSSYVIGLLLTAVQLLPSFDFYLDGERKLGELKINATYSDLKSLLVLLFPKFIPYTITDFCEIPLYFGVINFFVLLFSLYHIHNKTFFKYFLLLFFLYLLSFKPVSNIAETIIPCFSWFRSPSKLLFFVFIFLMPLYAYGLKYILSKRLKISKLFIISSGIFSVFIMAFCKEIFDFLMKIYTYRRYVYDNDMLLYSIIVSGILILLFSLFVYLKKFRVSKIILVLIMVVEPIIVMRTFSQTSEYKSNFDFNFYQREAFNEQTRFFFNINLDLISGTENISGAFPDAILNYTEFMKHLEKSYNYQNILGLLRCRYIVNGQAEHLYGVQETGVRTLNRLNMLYDYKIESDKEKIYDILCDDNFSIFNTVVLEKEPQFAVNKKGFGSIKPLYFDESSVVFECETDSPAIILYTDNYIKDWKAYEIDNPKQKYEVLCADYIYKAISIDKGYHKIKFEYKPKAFVIGKWISAVSWLMFLLSWIIFRRCRYCEE